MAKVKVKKTEEGVAAREVAPDRGTKRVTVDDLRARQQLLRVQRAALRQQRTGPSDRI